MVHATAIAIDGRGVLLIGASASGKSDLALRLIDRGATLISDDIVMVDVSTALPTLHATPNIQSKIEVRGVGIFAVPSVDGIALRLIVDLDAMPERLPSEPIYPLFGFDIPRIDLVAFEASAPLKIEYALRSRVDAAIFPVATRNSNSPESKPA